MVFWENLMKNTKIQSLNEIESYKDELAKIKVWVCSTSTGKSYLCSLDDRFYDLDAFQGTLVEHGEENYQSKVIDKMFEMIEKGKIITQASHSYFMEYLYKNHIPFVFMYGKPEVQDEYCQRMLHRGSGEEFVQRFGIGIAERYKDKTNDERPTYKIELNSGEYVRDYVWRIFGNPKKYIQFQNFDKSRFKIAFVDLDDTLLDLRGKLTPFTIKTIKEMQKKIKIVVASGRSAESVRPILDELGLNTKENYAICGCGALIINGCGEVITLNLISKTSIDLFLNSFDDEFLNCCYFNTVNGKIYYKNIKDIKNFIETAEVYKIVFEGKQEYNLPLEITSKFFVYGSNIFYEFVNKECIKENAIKKILQFENLSSDQAIAFGDTVCDVNMLKEVACGVAVCNADWEIKNSVNYIADSNNDDGVVKALLKILN